MEGRARILIVEDDADIARLLGCFLGQWYDVETAIDGEAGLALSLRSPPPDLVIADVMMPKLNGLQMVKEMRASKTTMPPPVIFLTARDRPADLIAGIRAGAFHYLMKPVQLDELHKKVRKALHE
jgi:DNA-binding response OmpR family regulator